MQTDHERTLKSLKGFFGLSILVYGLMSFILTQTVLVDMNGGFVMKADDPAAQQYLYIFSGLSLLMFVAQFLVPPLIKIEPTSSISRFAFCEAIAVWGFVLFLMTGQMIPSFVMMGLGLLTLVFGDRKGQKAL